MMKTLIVLAAIAGGAALLLAFGQTAFAMRSTPDLLATIVPGSSLARYGDRTIDLAVSWEGAVACAVTATGNVCFDSLSERDSFLGLGPPIDVGGTVVDPGFTNDVVWAGAVRLYSGPAFTGTSVAFVLDDAIIDLAAYSFANMTASFAVDACSSVLRDEANAVYPSVTTAGAARAGMAPGWANRVRVVQIA